MKSDRSLTAPIAAETLALHQQDWVVLLHGLFATRRSMRKLESRIRDVGYKVLNWGYPTWWRSTEQHVQKLLPQLRTLQDNSSVRSISFVTHSMGGILARCALHAGSDDKVKRLVMLAPPNRGSHLTRISLGPFAWCVPSIADLSESPDSLPNRLTVGGRIEIGVIAASRDFVVPVANTEISNQREHCILDSSHFGLPTHEVAVAYVLSFLQTGRFRSTADGVSAFVPRRQVA